MQLDLTFVVGHSSCDATEWTKIVGFIDHVVSNLPISQSEVRVAVVTDTSESEINWQLTAHDNVETLKTVNR